MEAPAHGESRRGAEIKPLSRNMQSQAGNRKLFGLAYGKENKVAVPRGAKELKPNCRVP